MSSDPIGTLQNVGLVAAKVDSKLRTKQTPQRFLSSSKLTFSQVNVRVRGIARVFGALNKIKIECLGRHPLAMPLVMSY
jgi:hypothetical protein